MLSAKLRYLVACTAKLASRESIQCPSCGCIASKIVARKYIVTSLRRCDGCLLLFRAPTTTAKENAQFYQEQYRQGFTSDTPTDEELASLLATRFRQSEKDYATYLGVLRALGIKPGSRILDFGCSWGYGSWQLQEAGYEVTAFEISRPRCRYAREKLGVNAFDSLADIRGQEFDVFFSAHVLEHVPSVSAAVATARSHIAPGGIFIAFTPNGSDAFRTKSPDIWMKLWNHVHPNFLDEKFYRNIDPDVLLASNPYDLARIAEQWNDKSQRAQLDGVELLAAWRM